MSDFGVGAELEFRVSEQSLRAVQRRVEQEVGIVSVPLDSATGAAGELGGSPQLPGRTGISIPQQLGQQTDLLEEILSEIRTPGVGGVLGAGGFPGLVPLPPLSGRGPGRDGDGGRLGRLARYLRTLAFVAGRGGAPTALFSGYGRGGVIPAAGGGENDRNKLGVDEYIDQLNRPGLIERLNQGGAFAYSDDGLTRLPPPQSGGDAGRAGTVPGNIEDLIRAGEALDGAVDRLEEVEFTQVAPLANIPGGTGTASGMGAGDSLGLASAAEGGDTRLQTIANRARGAGAALTGFEQYILDDGLTPGQQRALRRAGAAPEALVNRAEQKRAQQTTVEATNNVQVDLSLDVRNVRDLQDLLDNPRRFIERELGVSSLGDVTR